MSNYTLGEFGDLFDGVTGVWVGKLDAKGKEQLIASSRKRVLDGDYTLSASDDSVYFSASTPVTVTVPAGLSPMPQCIFIPPSAGSITLHPTGGAMLNGAATDIAINAAQYAVPAALAPTSTLDNYGVPVPTGTFAALTDDPKANTLLAAYLGALMPLAPGGNKLSAAYTVAATDNGAFLWMAAQAADKIISLPASIATGAPFWCVIGYLNPATPVPGRLKIQASGGATLNTSLAASGVLAGSPIFLGTANTAGIAAVLVCSMGNAPGGAFIVIPLCGMPFSAT